MNDNPAENKSAMSIIQDIRSGRLDPTVLDKAARQACVEALLGEACTKSQMAILLKVSEKTIGRDIQDVRFNNYLQPDEEFRKRMIGQLLMGAATNREHLMRLARKAESSVSERAQAEFLAFKVLTEMITKLQSLGHLPTQAQAIDLNVASPQEKSLDQLRSDLIELKTVCDDENVCVNRSMMQSFKQIEEKINKAEIVEDIRKLGQRKDEDHERDTNRDQ